MSKGIKWLCCAVLLSVVFKAEMKASNIPAASCSRSDVGNAVAQANDGDTVTIPACTQTNWSSTLTVTRCINLQGTGESATVLGDSVPKDGSDASQIITFNVNCPTGTLSLSNMTIVGVTPDSGSFNKGHIRILGTPGFFHVHHIVTSNPQTAFATTDTPSPGLFDHLSFPNCTPPEHGALNFKASAFGGGSFGDGSWSAPLIPGDSHQIYIEDSTWTCTDPTFVMDAVDGDAGARFVFRFNTLTGVNTIVHGLDSSQRERSNRWMEVYMNTFTYPATQAPDTMNWTRGGSSAVWGNTVVAPGGMNTIVKVANLRDTGAFIPWGQCNGSSPFDQNENGQSGYRCADQPGSGTSNAISGNPPTAAFLGNIVFPIYVFLNTLNGAETDTTGGATTNHQQANRDYYTFTNSFNGTTGVGSGPIAARPATCTTGVAFWATDQGFWNTKTPGVAAGQLYTCTATNVWTLFYTPFTYPYPSSATGPLPPTNLKATVH
jgi:hypothetical protein